MTQLSPQQIADQELAHLYSLLRDVKAQMRRSIHTTGTSTYRYINDLEAKIRKLEAARCPH